MSWTPAALAVALRYKHIFQELDNFVPGIQISDRHVPLLESACAWLDSYARQNPDSGIHVVDVSVVNGRLQVSVFPDILEVDQRMYDIRQKSAKVV